MSIWGVILGGNVMPGRSSPSGLLAAIPIREPASARDMSGSPISAPSVWQAPQPSSSTRYSPRTTVSAIVGRAAPGSRGRRIDDRGGVDLLVRLQRVDTLLRRTGQQDEAQQED